MSTKSKDILVNKEKVIDATGKPIGRVATLAAVALRGKDESSFARNIVPSVKVKITNASKMFVSVGKKKDKSYLRYTGFPGGLKGVSLEQLIEKKGIAEPLRLAVYGMLPGNKHRAVIMKNLSIAE